MESMNSFVKLILVTGFLIDSFEIKCVTANGCDISVLSGNASVISDTVVRSYISEKELANYVLCSLDAVTQKKVGCSLTPDKYLKLDQTQLTSNDWGLNFTLIQSVDELADKPISLTSISCPLSCASSEASKPSYVSLFNTKIVLVNDHIPSISQDNSVIKDFPESFPHGNHAFDLNVLYNLNIIAADNDTASDLSSKVTFSITKGNEDGTFSIETTSVNQNAANEYFVAHIYLEKQLSYQAHASYILTIQAKDEGSPPLSSTTTLTINVQQVNGTLGPAFDKDFYRATINESVLDGGKHDINMDPEDIHAKDQDTGSDVGITYTMLIDECGSSCEAIKNAFSIDETTAIITFDSSTHYEDINNFVAVFGVKATGKDANKRSSIAIVTIYLPPPPVTTTTEASTTTEKISTTEVPFTTTVLPTDATTTTPPTTCPPCTPCPTDSSTTEQPTDKPTTEQPTDKTTTTHPATGDTTIYSSTLTSSHTGSSEPPTTDGPITSTTPCVCPTTTVITTVCPTTETEGTSNTDWTASTGGESTTGFEPTSTTESKGTGTTKWTASTSFDNSSTSPSIETTVTHSPSVSTVPTSDTTMQCTTWTDASTTTTVQPQPPLPPPNPYFLETFHLSVATVVGTVVVQVQYHNDTTEMYGYSLTDCNEDSSQGTEYFSIDGISGAVSVIKALVNGNYCLNVTATSNSTNLQDSGTVVIEVIDGSTEEIFLQDYYEVHISEDVDTRTSLLDLNSTYETHHPLNVVYEIVTNVEAGLFFIKSSTGELFAIKGLDHEVHPLYQLIISVSMSSTPNYLSNGLVENTADFQFGNLTRSEALVQVFVDDVNDNYPIFDVGSTYSIGITSYLGQGQTVMTITATDADTLKEFNQIYYLMTDKSAPFFVNYDSGVLRATKSLEILQKSNPSNYQFSITAANSKNGSIMPCNLQLNVFILGDDEIIVMNTPESVVDFDALSAQIISTFKDKLKVDARIIQWEINEDGSNVVYLYMFPMASSGFQRVKRDTAVSAPLKNEEMLKMIKANAASLEPYFATNSAKSYTDVTPDGPKTTTGLIATIVVLAVLLAISVVVGATYGVLQYRKRIADLQVKSNPVYSNDEANANSNGHSNTSHISSRSSNDENFHNSYADVSKEPADGNNLLIDLELKFPINYDKTEKEPTSSINYMDHSSYSESINENVDHSTKVVPFEKLADTGEPITEMTATESRPNSEPELDYLKSILVDSNSKSEDQVEQRRKSVVKFADVVTNSDDEDNDEAVERL